MRWLLTVVILLTALPAWAAEIAVVDFQRAVNETQEGKAAQAKLNAAFQSRQVEIDKLRGELETKLADYDSRKALLSAAARESEERGLYELQARFEQMRMQAEGEMQQEYMSLLQGLDAKMRTVSAALAKERSVDIVLDKSTTVYVASGVLDLTNDLIRRYDAESK